MSRLRTIIVVHHAMRVLYAKITNQEESSNLSAMDRDTRPAKSADSIFVRAPVDRVGHTGDDEHQQRPTVTLVGDQAQKDRQKTEPK